MPRILLACTLLAAVASLAAPSHAQAADSPTACLPPALDAGDRAYAGATDYNVFLRPLGPLRAVMLFADFPDAPATESPQALYDQVGPPAESWYSEVSYGRLALQITPVRRWYRLARPSTSYDHRGANSFADLRALIGDAVAAADADVDFSPYQLAYVVASKGSAIDYSPAFIATSPFWGVTADGNTIRYGAALGTDARNGDGDYGAHVLEHETGHMFGLPDLYEPLPAPLLWRSVGGWDIMSSTATGAGFLAWQRLKLGWLDPSQIVCVTSPEQVTVTLAALETPGGVKAVVVKTGPATFTVVEIRRPVGADRRLCGRGVLVYAVASTPLTSAPIRIVRAGSDSDVFRIDQCAPADDAALDLGAGNRTSVFDPDARIRVDVLAARREGYRVAVVYGDAAALPARRAGRRNAPPV